MAIFFLIRHGQNDWVGKKLAGRLAGVHLNAHGVTQARRLAAGLADVPINAVFSSPLERAVETAEPIARVQGLSVQVFPDLLEIDFGSWQGKSLKRLQRLKVWEQVQKKPADFSFPKGESFDEAQTRVSEGLITLSKQFEKKERVVCVAHSDVIRLTVAHFLGVPLNNFQRIRIDPASVTVLYLQDGEAFLGTINYTFSSSGFQG